MSEWKTYKGLNQDLPELIDETRLIQCSSET